MKMKGMSEYNRRLSMPTDRYWAERRAADAATAAAVTPPPLPPLSLSRQREDLVRGVATERDINYGRDYRAIEAGERPPASDHRAKAALDAFDAAHPEIAAEVQQRAAAAEATRMAEAKWRLDND